MSTTAGKTSDHIDSPFLDEVPPLIIVEGFLGGFGDILKGKAEKHLNDGCGGKTRRAIFASVGPVSSLHDRACELYYAIVGGTVDYGEEHASRHNHRRYGRTIVQGLYPQWSRDRPLHFLGHSMGGPTITKLQWLIKTGHFGMDLHPDMILSVIAISAPFRGTPLTYTLGSSTHDAPLVRPLSFGSLLSKTIHIFSYISPFLPSPSSSYLLSPFDMHIEARQLTLRDISLRELFSQLWKSNWAESRDVAPFDVTFEAADEREQVIDGDGEGLVCEGTFYRSYVACITKKTRPDSTTHAPPFSIFQFILTPLYFASRIVGSYDYSLLRPAPSFFPHSSFPQTPSSHTINADMLFPAPNSFEANSDIEQGLCSPSKLSQVESRKLGEEYWANDGVVPIFSQWHPHACNATKCRHHPSSDLSHTTASDSKEPLSDYAPERGIWHVNHIDSAHHISLVPVWLGTSLQKCFWEHLGHWLRAVDAQC